MTAADILNTDVEALWRGARAGFDWWIGELSEMTPPWLKRLARGGVGLAAERGADGGYRFTRAGHPVAPPALGRSTPVTLLLPRAVVLMRSVAAPAVAAADVRALLTLDVDRLTPFRPEAVFTDVTVAKAVSPDGRRQATLAAVPRPVALAAVAHARAAGLDPRAVGVAGEAADDPPFDFLPRMREAGEVRRWGRGGAAWGAVAVLVVANIAAAVGRDVHDIAARRAVVENQRPAVAVASTVRRRVLAEEARRARIARARAVGEPLRMLAAVTRAVPDGAWVQRLAWTGGAVRLSGYRREDVDILAALRGAPLLHSVRDSTGDALAREAAGEPFDVTADVAPPAGMTPGRP